MKKSSSSSFLLLFTQSIEARHTSKYKTASVINLAYVSPVPIIQLRLNQQRQSSIGDYDYQSTLIVAQQTADEARVSTHK